MNVVFARMMACGIAAVLVGVACAGEKGSDSPADSDGTGANIGIGGGTPGGGTGGSGSTGLGGTAGAGAPITVAGAGGAEAPAAETWLDPDTGLIWEVSPAMPSSGNWYSLATAETYCADLNLAGSDDFRLPTIGELRGLILGCPSTHEGGSCGVTEDCTTPPYVTPNNCWSESSCLGCEWTSTEGCRWPDALRGTCAAYHSSTPANFGNMDLGDTWMVHFQLGTIDTREDWETDPQLWGRYLLVRCVRDPNAPPDPSGEGGAAGAGGAAAGAGGAAAAAGGATGSVSEGGAVPGGSAGALGTAGAAGTGSTPSPYCGDGQIDPETETCDDANAIPGDGCAGDCTTDVGWLCPVPGEGCVLAGLCGDDTLDPGEACDDGNETGGDGCSANCRFVEAGFACEIPGDACAGSLSTTCGDTEVQAEAGELCDDGVNDGTLECGLGCVFGPRCGDGLVDPGEECDDGSNVSEGAYGHCTAECSAGPYCGDGVVNGTEPCDNGENTSAYEELAGCAPGCRMPGYCGDGIVQSESGEECEPNTGVMCSRSCQLLE